MWPLLFAGPTFRHIVVGFDSVDADFWPPALALCWKQRHSRSGREVPVSGKIDWFLYFSQRPGGGSSEETGRLVPRCAAAEDGLRRRWRAARGSLERHRWLLRWPAEVVRVHNKEKTRVLGKRRGRATSHDQCFRAICVLHDPALSDVWVALLCWVRVRVRGSPCWWQWELQSVTMTTRMSGDSNRPIHFQTGRPKIH